uniref:G_PROTEIN_RECEP_F1_2 domain-containing protein n=1 Tax=Steinernema glaseri TaxID=37863 RepID=A0A1I7YKN2_9BILA
MAYSITASFCDLIVIFDLFCEGFLLYMILFRSHHSMKIFRFYLGSLCLSSTVLSILCGFIWQPEFLTHPLCIYTDGIFQAYLNNRGLAALSGALAVQYFQLLLQSFFYVYSRMNSLYVDQITPWRVLWKSVFILLPAAVFGTLLYFSNSTTLYIKRHTSLNLELYVSPACYFVGDLEADGLVNYAVGFLFTYSAFFASTACYVLFRVHRKLRNPSTGTSPRTLKLQRMFFMNVLMQAFVPVILVAAPLLTALALEQFGQQGYGTVLFKIANVSISLNSLISCCLVIGITNPYRRQFLKMLRWKTSTDTVAVVSGVAKMRRSTEGSRYNV